MSLPLSARGHLDTGGTTYANGTTMKLHGKLLVTYYIKLVGDMSTPLYDGKQPTYDKLGICNRCRYSWWYCNCSIVWIKNPDYIRKG